MKTPIFIILFFVNNFQLFAQWESMHGPFGSYINDIGQNSHYVYAASTAGLYRSDDLGLTWTHISFTGNDRYPCLQFDIVDSVLVADAVEIRPDTTIRHMYKSVDEGNTWIEIPRPPVPVFVEIGIVGNTIFANDFHAIWITQDEGSLWKHSNVNHLFLAPRCFERFGSKVYVGADKNLFVYEGLDNNWKEIKVSPATFVDAVFVTDSLILVRDYDKENLYVSDDNGSTWLNSPGSQWNSFENYFAAIGDTIYATGYDEIYVSFDHGHSWATRISQGPYNHTALMSTDSILFLGEAYSGLYRSSDFGRQFHYSSEGMDATFVEKLFLYNNQLLTGGISQGVFNYDFQSHQWGQTYFDEYSDRQCSDLEESNGDLVMASSRVFWYQPTTGEWIANSPIFPGTYTDLFTTPYGLMAGGARFSSPGPLSVYTTFDDWDPFYAQFQEDLVYLFAQNSQCQFVAGRDRIARSYDDGQHWEWLPDVVEPGTFILDMININDAVFVIQSEDQLRDRLYVSYDNGTTWAAADAGIPMATYQSGVSRILDAGDYLVCCVQGYNSGVYFSRKDQLQWCSFNEGLPYLGIRDIITDGQYIYAACSGNGTWKRKLSDLNLTSTQEEQIGLSSPLYIYPNPASDILHISLLQTNAEKVSALHITDMSGQCMFNKKYDSSDIREFNDKLDVSSLVPGVYLLQLVTTQGIQAEKVVITR